MSSVAAVACPRCQNSLPGALCNTGAPVSCPACESTIMLVVIVLALVAAQFGRLQLFLPRTKKSRGPLQRLRTLPLCAV